MGRITKETDSFPLLPVPGSLLFLHFDLCLFTHFLCFRYFKFRVVDGFLGGRIQPFLSATMGIEYTAVPQSAEGGSGVDDRYNALGAGDDTTTTITLTGDKPKRRISSYEFAKRTLILFNLLMFGLIMGFCVGRQHPAMNAMSGSGGDGKMETTSGLLPPSAFVPDSEYTILSLSPFRWGNQARFCGVESRRLTCENKNSTNEASQI